MDAIQNIRDLDFVTWILMGFMIMAAIVAAYEIICKIATILNKPIGAAKQRKEDHRLLMETIKEVGQYADNRKHDREQSFKIQKELTDTQKELKNSLLEISNKIDNMQTQTDKRFEESEAKNNKRIRAELKDKISQSYRYYHSLGKINDMELEALEDLIAEYEAAKGENSFVHSVVQKEMYTWEKVERM